MCISKIALNFYEPCTMFTKLGNCIAQLFRKIYSFLCYPIFGTILAIPDFFSRRENHVELKDKSNHAAVVTGGSLGIGKQTVQMLLKCNMDVVIGCPEIQEGEAAIRSIREAGITKGKVSVIELDYRNFKSVQKFASTFHERYNYLNLLVNNAGIIITHYEETVDGHESHFAVNYLGHFLLTHLLLPAMVRATAQFDSNPRIINVSSIAHLQSPPLNFDDIELKNDFHHYVAYAQSKLCQLMFAKALDRKLKKDGYPIQVMAVHPGVVNSGLTRGWFEVKLPIFNRFGLMKVFGKSPRQGAQTIVFCCIDDATENAGGLFYSNCTPTKCRYTAEIIQHQDKLYEFSMKAIEKFLPKKE